MNVGKERSKATQVTVIKNNSDCSLCFIIIVFIFSLCIFYKEQTGLVQHHAIHLSLQVHLLNQLRDFHKLDMNYPNFYTVYFLTINKNNNTADMNL
jgi:hypothetical protein